VYGASASGTVALELQPCSRIADIKEQLHEQCGIPTQFQSLTCGLRTLSDEDSTLESQGIEDGSSLYMSLALLGGGGKKRKKKNYTTPKKIKHKKKKVKLAVLKFYKVDASDKVTRLRKECPAATCGPGVFMANHQNRTYCGRCGVTYLLKSGA